VPSYTAESFLVPWRSYDEIPDDFQLITNGRTITEADLVLSALSGSFAPLHSDVEWVRKNTNFKDRLLPGPSILGYALNLLSSTLVYRYLIVAFLGLDKVKAQGVVIPGDTITAHVKLASKRKTSKQDKGILVFDIAVKNQRDETVMTMDYSVMIRLAFEG
jgi:acyl dehydratase